VEKRIIVEVDFLQLFEQRDDEEFSRIAEWSTRSGMECGPKWGSRV